MEFAREHSLRLHMDGARFANAVTSLGCRPRVITWEFGVDVLSFGGTKNGLAAGELIVFFDRELARQFDYRLKQGGQLASKMRFLAAPWSALMENDLWLRNARHANAMAALLERKLRAIGQTDFVFPREASAIFVRLSGDVVERAHAAGWSFQNFFLPDVYRLMCSWNTTETVIDTFIADLRA
jgi:threonine aldolase